MAEAFNAPPGAVGALGTTRSALLPGSIDESAGSLTGPRRVRIRWDQWRSTPLEAGWSCIVPGPIPNPDVPIYLAAVRSRGTRGSRTVLDRWQDLVARTRALADRP